MANILTIEKIARERDTVTIADRQFEILFPDEFGPFEQAQLFRAYKRVEKLFDEKSVDEDISPATRKLALEGLREMVRTILPKIPDSLLYDESQLSPTDLFNIGQAFIEALQVWQVKEKAKKTPPVAPAQLNAGQTIQTPTEGKITEIAPTPTPEG
jgi:hypothetical protein